MEKRRPMRPHFVMDEMPMNEGLDALSSAASLAEQASLQKNMERRALYNDVDYNGHVNNVSYIRWMEDAVEPALLEQAKQMRLDINYLNEVLPNDVIGIWSARLEDPAAAAFVFEGRKEPENQAAFRAELRLWQ
jgi:acyl-ACP thioesterase